MLGLQFSQMKIDYYFGAQADDKREAHDFKIGLCLKQKSQRQFKDDSYPLCHLLLQKRFNYGKDAFENPGLVNYVNSLDSDWKPIL